MEHSCALCVAPRLAQRQLVSRKKSSSQVRWPHHEGERREAEISLIEARVMLVCRVGQQVNDYKVAGIISAGSGAAEGVQETSGQSLFLTSRSRVGRRCRRVHKAPLRLDIQDRFSDQGAPPRVARDEMLALDGVYLLVAGGTCGALGMTAPVYLRGVEGANTKVEIVFSLCCALTNQTLFLGSVIF